MFLLHCTVTGQTKWTFEYQVTLPYNLPLPLSIHQAGQSDIDLTARYSSEPFVVPIAWLWRLSYWSASGSWAFQAIHHKLYLDNPPAEVRDFSITHGFNLIEVSRGWLVGGFILRAGGGFVLAHPENTIRGKHLAEDQGILNWGYYIAGPSIHIGAGKEFELFGGFFVACEAMVNLAYASVPVVDGSAKVHSIAARLNVGLGFSFFEMGEQ